MEFSQHKMLLSLQINSCPDYLKPECIKGELKIKKEDVSELFTSGYEDNSELFQRYSQEVEVLILQSQKTPSPSGALKV